MTNFNYTNLIEEFLKKSISVSDFEKTYLEKFKQETGEMEEEEFLILDNLFAEVDAYTDDLKAVADEPEYYIDENQLRASAEKTLEELKKLA